MVEVELTIIVIGNPGAGKSALLNSCTGKINFESGLSPAVGLTILTKSVIKNNKRYTDTPGLEDIERVKQAASEITAGLRQSGRYKIIFVVKTDEGRLKPADMATIATVLDALPSDAPYGVAVNAVPPLIMHKIKTEEQGQTMKTYVTHINANHRPTPHFCFIPEIPELRGQDNFLLPAPPAEFLDLLERLPSYDIPPEAVKDIKHENFAAKIKEMTDLINELKASNEKSEIEHQRQLGLLNNQIAALEASIRSSGGRRGCSIL